MSAASWSSSAPWLADDRRAAASRCAFVIRPIGGFLPLCVPAAPPRGPSVLAHWTQGAASVWRLHNARSGLHALWNLLRPRAVWLPGYVCEEVAKAVPPGIATRY